MDIAKVYYSAYNVTIKMLKDRGYVLPSNIKPVTSDQFLVMFDKRQMDIPYVSDHNGIPTYVKFIESSQPFTKGPEKKRVFDNIASYFNSHGFPDIKDTESLEESADKGLIRLMIVYNGAVGRATQNQYEKNYAQNPFIEIHEVHNLAIDPIECKYQPKWRLISDAEAKEIKKRYDAQPTMFSGVAIDDPMNRYYRGRPAENGKPAQMYEIIRKGNSITYRRVLAKIMNLKTK